MQGMNSRFEFLRKQRILIKKENSNTLCFFNDFLMKNSEQFLH